MRVAACVCVYMEKSVGISGWTRKRMMWSSCVRVFIVGFAVLTTLWSKEVSAALTVTSTKVVVPDLVGLLYPQHTQHVVQFGSSKSATTYSSAFTTSPSLPTCDSTSFCLDLVVHSAFEFDPFVLVAYESKYPIASETFGNAAVVNEYPNVRPVVEGSGESGTGTGGNPGYLETLWRFNAVDGAKRIDVVFRLRQLSQWNSQKDQAIVHIATQAVDDFTSTTSVDAYVVYGNARVQHKTSQVQQNQVRLDIDITRNASQPNVGSEDAYPLVPINVSPRTLLWSYGESTCLECTALLYGCTPEDVSSDSCTFDSSTAPLPSCLRSTYGLTSAWFVDMLSYTAGYQVPIKNWIDTCLRNIFNEEFGLDLQWSNRRWFNGTAALNCLSSQSCPFGPLNSVLPIPGATKLIQLGGMSSYGFKIFVHNPMFSGNFVFTFGASYVPSAPSMESAIITEGTTPDEIRDLLSSLLVDLRIPSITTRKRLDAPGQTWEMEVIFSSMAFPDLTVEFRISGTPSIPKSETQSSDGFPVIQLVPMNESKLRVADPCDDCAVHLGDCQANAMCQAVITCLIQGFESLEDTATLEYDAVYGTYSVNIRPILESCTANTTVPAWNPIRRSLMCISNFHCGVSESESSGKVIPRTQQTIFKLSNGSQRLDIPVDNDVVSLIASGTYYQAPQEQVFNAPYSALASFMQSFVLENVADVEVEAQPSASDSGLLRIDLRYSNMLVTNPVFSTTVLENVQPKSYLEVVSPGEFSVKGMIAVLRRYNSVIVEPPKHAWTLSQDCQACIAQLYGCTNTTSSITCYYENATTPLGACLRAKLPTSTYMTLLNENRGMVISSELTHCQGQVRSQIGETLTVRQRIASSLSCFPRYSCPFGPVELVRDDSMVELQSTSYKYILRIKTPTFRVQLEHRLGKYVAGVAVLTDGDAQLGTYHQLLQIALSGSGISPGVPTIIPEAEKSEWYLEIHYQNVLVSDFSVVVAANSTPDRTALDEVVMKPTARLVIAPRSQSSVFRDAATPSPSMDKTAQCNACDSTHLASCMESSYCRTVASCVLSWLSSNAGVGSGPSLELIFVVQNCAQTDPSSFLDWWEPLQSWFGCYSWYSCPISQVTDTATSATTSYITIQPLTDTVIAPAQLTSTGGMEFNFQISAPVQSSFSNRGNYAFTGTTGSLRDFLEHITHGVAWNVSILTTDVGSGMRELSITYGSSYLGAPPSFSGDSVTTRVSVGPRLTIQSSDRSSSVDFSRLKEKISNALTTPPSYGSCDTCQAQTLYLCQSMPKCQGYLLECLANTNFVISGDHIYGADRNFQAAIFACVAGLDQADWLPLRRYISCRIGSQCPANEPSPAPAPAPATPVASSFIRQRRARQHFYIPSPASAVVLQYRLKRTDPFIVFEGPVYQFLSDLKQALNDSGTDVYVESYMWELTGSSGSLDVEFIYHGFQSTLPEITGNSVAVWNFPFELLAFSSEPWSLSTDAMSYTFRSYMVTPQCTDICESHLEACTRANSEDALFCRERVLPCFRDQVSNIQVSTTEADITGILLQCAAGRSLYSYLPIVEFLFCFARTGCTLNTPQASSPRTELRIVPTMDVLVCEYNQIHAYWGYLVYDVPSFLRAVQYKLYQQMPNVTASVDAIPASSDNPSAMRFTITYENAIGWQPSLFSDDWYVSRTVGKISIFSTDPERRDAERLVAALDKRILPPTRSCGDCASTHLFSCTTCAFNVLPCMLSKIGPYETSLLEHLLLCALYFPPTSWLPMVKFFQCYQRNGCITSEASSTEDPFAAFIVISDAFQNVGVSTSSWDVFQVRPPQLTVTSGTPRPIDVDRGSNYQQFVHSLGAMLAESAQDVRIRAVELPADPSQYYIPLEVTYYNFVGIAPTIYGSSADGNGLRGGDIMLRTLTGVQSGTSVLAMMLRTYSTTRVLNGLCAACGAALFGCDQSAIASGSCTFLQPGASSFTACLRQSSYLNFFLTQVAQRDVRKLLATQSCYDTSSSGATFKEDQWYKTSEALACFETAGCPFGPLHESIWDDNMVRISSNTITQNTYIPVNTFEASFRAVYVSRQLDSDPFDASATPEDLEALLLMVLPESAEVSASISPSGDGYTITVTYHLVFVPSLQLSVVVSDPSVNVQNSSPSSGLVVELSTVTTDPTTFAVI